MTEDWRVTLRELAGRWRLERRIVHAGGSVGVLSGICAFEDDEDGLRQVEVGTLRLAGREMAARQVYLWRPGPDVRFSDGRAFHEVGAGRRPVATHLCGNDVYRVSYGFDGLAEGRWCATWQVRGPRKDYEMRSLYARRA